MTRRRVARKRRAAQHKVAAGEEPDGPLAVIGAVGAAATIASGFSQMSAATKEANALNQQARIQMSEAERDAQQRATQVREFQAEQSVQYAKSGFTLQGTPALELERTRRLGQDEVDSILRQGAYASALTKQKASMTKSAGRNALIGSFIKAGTNAASLAIGGANPGVLGNTSATYALSASNGGA